MFANDYAKRYCKSDYSEGGGFNMTKIDYVICERSFTAIA